MILEGLRALRSISSFHPSDPAGWWAGDGDSATGIEVTPISALANTPLYQGLDLISSSLGVLPLLTYRLNAEGNPERDREGQLYNILRWQPNREATAFVHRKTQTLNKLLWGNAYAEIERDAGGNPVAIWHLPSWLVTPHRVYKRLKGGLTTSANAATPEDRKRGGEIWYKVEDGSGGTPVWLPAMDVWHVPNFSLNGVTGHSIFQLHRESIGVGLALLESAAAIYGQASDPHAVLERPQEAAPLTPIGERNLLAAWEAQHKGVRKRGRAAVLQEGTVYKPVMISMKELQYAEALKNNVPECSRILNIRPYFLGHDGSQNTYTNVEGEWTSLTRQTLLPHTTADEHEVMRKLVFSEDEGQVYAEYEYKVLLKGSSTERATYFEALRRMGAITPGEIARLEGLPPVPEDQGGQTWKATTAAPPPPPDGEQPPPKKQPPPPVEPDADDEEDATRALLAAHLEAAWQRVVNREVKELRAMTKRFTVPEELRQAVELFYRSDLPGFASPIVDPGARGTSERRARAYAITHLDELEQTLSAGSTESASALLERWTTTAAAEQAARDIAELFG